ncbi:response regulator transcription factor [Roseibacillus ishigakijimensis]|uniref:Response regulator transcription factor n=1 Tax=Roseibacillus ishigakijimensis TaxID=454146 RepID=A0A934RTQ3_9BACT|nr:response regulator transcription factor [Roseibacillus ishigakijimensis]MBK1835481.1 response regulator transcription factor [Roseibacillus ishigakijimensis]
MEAPTILVVEDDHAVRQGVVDALTFSGYQVLSAADGAEGLRLGLQANYQLMLLDLILPKLGGFELLAEVQRQRPGQAVIILSAKGEEDDRVRGLKLGADDYVLKPFGPRELLARVHAVLRRSKERPPVVETWSYLQGTADFSRCEIRYREGGRCELSEREGQLLRYLAAHSGRAVSRDELLQRLWGVEAKRMETRTIDMHIVSLRKKLRAPEMILTVRGKGYMLERSGDEPG